MKTIDIADILTPDLKSRMRAQDLKLMTERIMATTMSVDEYFDELIAALQPQ